MLSIVLIRLAGQIVHEQGQDFVYNKGPSTVADNAAVDIPAMFK